MEQSVIPNPNRTRPADAFMRRALRVRTPASAGPERPRGASGGPERPRGAGERSAENIFGVSLLISTVRCLLTYVLLPLLAPIMNLSGRVGPAVGLLLSIVSSVAIIASMRRFWAADHRWRWGYTFIGGAILVLLAIQSVGDIAALV